MVTSEIQLPGPAAGIDLPDALAHVRHRERGTPGTSLRRRHSGTTRARINQKDPAGVVLS